MTTYTPAANIATDPNDPVSSEVGTALKNNPLAIQEGDTTAPRVSALANGPIVDYSRFTTGNVGSLSPLCQIDLGQSRKAVVLASCGFTANADSDTGTSNYRIQGSNNNSSWTDLKTIENVSNVATIVAGPTLWDGRSSDGNAAYRYYRIEASGSSIHKLRGRAMIECLGTEDES